MSRFQLSSNAFYSLHARLIRNLIQTVPALLTTEPVLPPTLSLTDFAAAAHPPTPAPASSSTAAPAAPAPTAAVSKAQVQAASDSTSIIDHLIRLCADVHEPEQQCTAAELMSGALRALKHAPVSADVWQKMNKVVESKSLCFPRIVLCFDITHFVSLFSCPKRPTSACAARSAERMSARLCGALDGRSALRSVQSARRCHLSIAESVARWHVPCSHRQQKQCRRVECGSAGRLARRTGQTPALPACKLV